MARLAPVWPGPGASGYPQLDAEIPFPVEAPFAVRPDLVKLSDSPILVQDGQWPQWTSQKRAAVCAGEMPLIDQGLQQDQWTELVHDVAQTMHRLVPSGPIDAQGAFPWLGGVQAQSAMEFFAALAMSMQEDFALMVPDHHGRLIARVLCVAFASGWDPKEKLGMPLSDIHAPVADNQALQRATRSMEQAMVSKGPFVRYVWTLAGNGAFKRAPGEDTLAHAQTLNDLWYRCERQVTVPVAGKACLFLIRVFVAPLTQVLQGPDRMQQMKAALVSMSPQMLDYKGIGKAARIILESNDG